MTTAAAAARQQFLADYGFIPIFFTLLAVLGMLAAGWFDRHGAALLRDTAIALAWGQWLVGLMDFAENTTLLRSGRTPIRGFPTGCHGFPAGVTRLKFLLIFLSVGVCGYALLAQWVG